MSARPFTFPASVREMTAEDRAAQAQLVRRSMLARTTLYTPNGCPAKLDSFERQAHRSSL